MYLKIKNGASTKQYTLTDSYAKPYLKVSGSVLPLTTSTTSGLGLKIKDGNTTYRPLEYGSASASASATFYTTAANSEGLTDVTALTRSSTSGESYLTRASTSGTSYGTRTQPGGTTYFQQSLLETANHYYKYTRRDTELATAIASVEIQSISVGNYYVSFTVNKNVQTSQSQNDNYDRYTIAGYRVYRTAYHTDAHSNGQISSTYSSVYVGFQPTGQAYWGWVPTSWSSYVALEETAKTSSVKTYYSADNATPTAGTWRYSRTTGFVIGTITQTTGTTYLTRSSTSETSYLTCASTSGYSGVSSSSSSSESSGWQ